MCVGCTETVYRLRDQRQADLPLHAEEQEHGQVSHLEARRLVAVRVLHHGDDHPQHRHPDDEGTSSYSTRSAATDLHRETAPFFLETVHHSDIPLFHSSVNQP